VSIVNDWRRISRRLVLTGATLSLGSATAIALVSQARAQQKIGQANAKYQTIPKGDQHVGKRLHPGSLSQKQINLFGKPSSGGIVLQKEVISPGKRYETSTGDPGRHLTALIAMDNEVVT
jgi:hypothetical protein